MRELKSESELRIEMAYGLNGPIRRAWKLVFYQRAIGLAHSSRQERGLGRDHINLLSSNEYSKSLQMSLKLDCTLPLTAFTFQD